MPYIRISADGTVSVGFLAKSNDVEDAITAFVGEDYDVLYSDNFIMKITEDIPNIVMIHNNSLDAALDQPENSWAADLLCSAYVGDRECRVFGDALLFKIGSRKDRKTGIVELSDDDVNILNALLGE